MARSRRHAIVACLALGLLSIELGSAQAQVAGSPEALLQQWMIALDDRNHTTYVDCLHPLARQAPQYASEEAMVFWANEMDDLKQKGFAGQFKIETVVGGGDRFPPGSTRAYPIVNGEAIGEAILLMEDDGVWKIVRLFS